MAAPKTVVAASEAVDKTPAPASPTETAPAKLTVFWKTMNPFEKIVFSDRTTFVFGAQRFVTADENLAKKISEVADKYGILTQNGE